MKNITYKLPVNDKEVFVNPAIDRIPDLVRENKGKIHEYRFEINSIPFQALRNKTREELLHKAVQYTNRIKSLLREQGKYGQTSLSMPPLNSQLSIEVSKHRDRLHVAGEALNYGSIKNISIIQTGHEPILYHPGIWIKNHLTHYLVKKMDGVCVNMVVDNDACNMGFMYAPVLWEKPASVQKVPLVKNMNHVAYEEIVFDDMGIILRFKEEVLNLLKKNVPDKSFVSPLLKNGNKTPPPLSPIPPGEGKTRNITISPSLEGKGAWKGEKVKATVENMQAMFENFMNRMMTCYHQGCIDMAGLLTAARHAVENDFGIDNLEIPVSWMCDTDGFYHFLLHILYNADRFVKIYNKKLAEYRAIHKIRSKANPLPDLKITENLVELPFWVWKAGEQRNKCYLLNDGESIKFTDGVDVLLTLKNSDEAMKDLSRLKTLKEANIKIRPRAITTTMFSRLFFSDVFIHGIGGAKYDTITDEIIKEFFGIDPPSFVTISATLFLPFATFDLDTRTLQTIQHSLKDMSYNPERYAPKETQNDMEFTNRAQEKQRLLGTMPSCSRDERKWCFDKIKELNKLMQNQIHTELLKKRREIDAMSENLVYNEIVRFREYPICIYPSEVLKNYFSMTFSEV